MIKGTRLIIADYSQETSLTFTDLCEICQISSDFIEDLIALGIVRPQITGAEEDIFTLKQLQRIKTAIRLHRDLEVNLTGVAVILDLLDELEDLRSRLNLMEKHLWD